VTFSKRLSPTSTSSCVWANNAKYHGRSQKTLFVEKALNKLRGADVPKSKSTRRNEEMSKSEAPNSAVAVGPFLADFVVEIGVQAAWERLMKPSVASRRNSGSEEAVARQRGQLDGCAARQPEVSGKDHAGNKI
jgi:hypothetical protein